MIRLGYYDWSLNVKPGHDSYCWRRSKRIDIGLDYGGDIRQIILHEISHIDTARFCNQKHNPTFWKRFDYLCWKFLRQSPDEIQCRHKKWQSNGYYSIKYKE